MGLRDEGLGFIGLRDLGFRVTASGFRVHRASGFRVYRASGFRV